MRYHFASRFAATHCSMKIKPQIILNFCFVFVWCFISQYAVGEIADANPKNNYGISTEMKAGSCETSTVQTYLGRTDDSGFSLRTSHQRYFTKENTHFNYECRPISNAPSFEGGTFLLRPAYYVILYRYYLF